MYKMCKVRTFSQFYSEFAVYLYRFNGSFMCVFQTSNKYFFTVYYHISIGWVSGTWSDVSD